MGRSNQKIAQVFLRIALSVTMLSAVADRFGFWGSHSVWGNWKTFEAYCRQITTFLPESLSTVAAYSATSLEVIFSILLLFGFKTKWTALATGILLMLFALSMCITLGIKSTLDYSVWIGSAASFLLASQHHPIPLSIDRIISGNFATQQPDKNDRKTANTL